MSQEHFTIVGLVGMGIFYILLANPLRYRA